MILYSVWSAIATLLRVLPPTISYGIASFVGAAGFFLWPRGRRSSIANYTVMFPGWDRGKVRAAARRSLELYCHYLVDFARFSGTQPRVPQLVMGQEHLERMKALLERCPGAVVALTHSGNWDALGAAAVEAGIPLTVVAESFGDERLDRDVLGAREAMGMEIALMGKRPRALFSALRDGRALAVLVDRPDPDGVPVTFFGQETRVADGAARLALRAGVPVVAAAATRVRSGSADLRLDADFDIAIPTDPRAPGAPGELMQAIFDAHERMIRRHPTQWYMFRSFWRTGVGHR